jgi:hypothetical protein
MVFLLVGLSGGTAGQLDPSSVEVSTIRCIEYKHAFACFVPCSGTFFPEFQFYGM